MHRLDHFLSLGALQEPTRLFLRDGKDWTYGAANEEVRVAGLSARSEQRILGD